jgi:hypothetical protein
LLLSTSSGEEHHHQRGHADIGLGYVVFSYFLFNFKELTDSVQTEFPAFLTFVTLMSHISTALCFNIYSELVNSAFSLLFPIFSDANPVSAWCRSSGQLQAINTLIRPSIPSCPHCAHHSPSPTSPLATILSNPSTTRPLFICSAILSIALTVPLTLFSRSPTSITERFCGV